MVGGDQELGVEDRALGVGTLRAVGKLGQVALPGGDRLGEFCWPWRIAPTLNDAVIASSAQSRRASVVSTLKPALLEELGEGVEGLVALSPGEVRHGELIGRANRFGCAGNAARKRRRAATPWFRLVSSGGLGIP